MRHAQVPGRAAREGQGAGRGRSCRSCWKPQVYLYKTELPRGQSHFTLDKDYLSSLGPFGGHLVVAQDLLKEIEAEVERERNPPSQIKKSALEQSVPHYMQTTSSMKIIRNTINETSRLGSVKQQTVKLQREKERSIAREKN